jgi:hypothetical protein
MTVASAVSERELIDEIMDGLAITERVFYDLKHTQPLTEALVREVRRLRPDGRVLLVAANETLPRVLSTGGYEVDLWQPPTSVYSRDLTGLVRRVDELNRLLATAGEEMTDHYDLVVLPYVLDALEEHPIVFLRRVRGWLRPGGRVILAHRRSGSLGNRWRGLRGRPLLPDPLLTPRSVSLSWPSLPTLRLFGRLELRAWCELAALKIERQTLVMDKEATVACRAMPLGRWFRAEALHNVKRAIRPLRDCGVATLAAAEPAKP